MQQNQGHGQPQTGRLSPIPTISCCKITGGDEFLLITTPAVSDTMSAQNAVSIGSRALQDSGPMHPSSTAHKELCFKAAGRIITKAMRVAPEKAGGIAAHVIFFKTQEPEAIVPRTSKHQCILKQRQEKCESCLDPREELSPRPHNSAKSCMLCKLKLNHEDWQCLNTPHEPGRSSSSKVLPGNTTLRLGYRKVCVTGPTKHKGRYGILAVNSAGGQRWPIVLPATPDHEACVVTTEEPELKEPQPAPASSRQQGTSNPLHKVTRRTAPSGTVDLTLEEDEPEKVSHDETPDIGRLTDHFQNTQPLTRVEVRPYNAKTDKDCAGTKLRRSRLGEEYNSNLESLSFGMFKEGDRMWTKMQQKALAHHSLTNQGIPRGAIGSVMQVMASPFHVLPGDEAAGLGSANSIDDGVEEAPLCAWWKGMADGARHCVTILGEKMHFRAMIVKAALLKEEDCQMEDKSVPSPFGGPAVPDTQQTPGWIHFRGGSTVDPMLELKHMANCIQGGLTKDTLLIMPYRRKEDPFWVIRTGTNFSHAWMAAELDLERIELLMQFVDRIFHCKHLDQKKPSLTGHSSGTLAVQTIMAFPHVKPRKWVLLA